MPATSSPAISAPFDSPSSLPTPSSGASLPTRTQSRQSTLSRPLSHASKSRLSQYSTAGSLPSSPRPQSHLYPMFPSSLPYAQVRDFAYPAMHPLHYGPPPEPSGPPSGLTTPASERRLSDPPAPWEQKMPWESWSADKFGRGHDLPPIHFGDGPPYSEDDDLQSPVVSTRHRKHKSSSSALNSGRGRNGREVDGAIGINMINRSSFDDDAGYLVAAGRDTGERYYVDPGLEANGHGGEFVTYPADQARHHQAHAYGQTQMLSGNDGYRSGSEESSRSSSPDLRENDQSRYSRDYQFTITSPDEEFHGKAVALFDFERENENELPLVEGQIIWVSYRHGQGWLVAEDPKTQESGLVPEEYVRLLRDIEGGMTSLTGEGTGSPNEAGTPVQQDSGGHHGHTPTHSISTNGYNQPVVSVFSTSSKDLNPYPTEQLGLQSGQAPPQVVHYHGQRGGSQASAQTLAQLQEAGIKPVDSVASEQMDTGVKGPLTMTTSTTTSAATTTTATTQEEGSSSNALKMDNAESSSTDR